ncbi:hypothetical protein KSP39_PZI015356 [Platanthera zijinensis]|uniref:Uncharacterized protein n=1 Tax=Platanthera zijinensis TaxID=2320716 RepID=A0AAP0BA44_9ASPA
MRPNSPLTGIRIKLCVLNGTTKAEMTAAEGGVMTAMARVERLNHVLLCLEEIRAGGGGGSRRWSSGRSSSSVGSSPTTRLRSMDEVIVETRVNGSLIDRITALESRLLKLEEEVENERKREEGISPPNNNNSSGKEMKQQQHKKKSFKSIVKTCVRGQLNTND